MSAKETPSRSLWAARAVLALAQPIARRAREAGNDDAIAMSKLVDEAFDRVSDALAGLLMPPPLTEPYFPPPHTFDRDAWSARIRAVMARRGMSYGDVADEVEVSRATAHRVAREHGEAWPDVETYLRVNEWLAVMEKPK